jgi:hypothetical protein
MLILHLRARIYASYNLQPLDHRHKVMMLPYEDLKQLYSRLLSAVT